MHLFGFVGTGDYHEVVYSLDGREAPASRYAPIALARLLDCEAVTVFETPEARAKHHEALEKAADRHRIAVEFEPIPGGKTESEQWEIFSALERAARDLDEEIALDVTHGFRTLPLIAFLTAAFLRVSVHAPLTRLLYGAYDARDEETDRAPVFDLTPFLVLVDWLVASDTFRKTGDARYLAELLENRQKALWSAPHSGECERPKQLNVAASALRDCSESLRLLRRDHRRESLTALSSALDEARDEIVRYAPPFATLLGHIDESFSSLWEVAADELRVELRQIRWLLKTDHVDAALTLEREWLVSWTALRRGAGEIPGTHESREKFENFLNACAKANEGKSRGGRSSSSFGEEDITEEKALEWKEIAGLWSRIRSARNDLSHAGYVEHAKKAHRFATTAREVLEELEKLEQEGDPRSAV